MTDLPNSDLTVYTHEEEEYFVAKDIMKLLSFSAPHFARTLKYVSIGNKVSFLDFPGEKIPKQNWKETLVSRGGVRELLSRARNAKDEDLELLHIKYGFDLPKTPPSIEECMETKPRELTKYYYTDEIQGEQVFFIGYEVAALLDYKGPIQTIRTHVDKDNQLLFKDFPGEKVPNLPGRTTLINKKGASQLLIKTRKLITADVECIFREVGVVALNKKSLCKEQQFLSPIKELLKMYGPEDQYAVGKYKLDMYFPIFKVVVSCDEFGHVRYKPKEEIERESFVNDALDISTDNWVRFNPDARDFDLKRTVRIIMAKIELIKEARVQEEKAKIKEDLEMRMKALETMELREVLEAREAELLQEATQREDRLKEEFQRQLDSGSGKLLSKYTKLPKRQQIIELIKDTYKLEDVRQQHKVGPYHLDLYFPRYRLAIDCGSDGPGEKRKNYVNSKVRIDDDNWVCIDPNDFNFASVVERTNSIMKIHSNGFKAKYITPSKAHKNLNLDPEKPCNICKVVKKLEEFNTARDHRDGRENVCTVCRRSRQNEILLEKRAKLTFAEEKECNICHEEKPLKDFYKDKNAPDGHMRRCKDCHNKRQKAPPKQRIIITEKRCTCCKEVKPVPEGFYKMNRAPDGYRIYCKACSKMKVKHANEKKKLAQKSR